VTFLEGGFHSVPGLNITNPANDGDNWPGYASGTCTPCTGGNMTGMYYRIDDGDQVEFPAACPWNTGSISLLPGEHTLVVTAYDDSLLLCAHADQRGFVVPQPPCPPTPPSREAE
jgi:hypothetical protein